MAFRPREADGRETVVRTAITVYPSDLKDAERIRKHLDLDNISQAIRRSIRMTAKQIESETQPANESDAA